MLRWSSETRHGGDRDDSPVIGPDARPTRRASERTTFTGSVTIIPCPSRTGHKPIEAVVTDLSPRGVGLVLHFELHEREELIFVLPAAMPGGRRAILCTVTHCRAAGPGRFAIGGRFSRILGGHSADAGAAMLQVDELTTSITSDGLEHLRRDRLGQRA